MSRGNEHFELDASSSEPRYERLLRTVIASDVTHARWLNTLSLLEHIGSRKIVKALDSTYLTETLLRHIAEETRHAYFFKRLSTRVKADCCPTYEDAHLLAGPSARRYFRDLDEQVNAYLAKHAPEAETFLRYLCVTELVERRAVEIYRVYDRLLREHDRRLSIASVLREEDQHMQEMRAAFEALAFDWSTHQPLLQELEAELCARWLEDVEARVLRPAAVAQGSNTAHA